jgi:hypothetical protein
LQQLRLEVASTLAECAGAVLGCAHNDGVAAVNETALVGRDRALEVAGASVAAALAGQPRLVLIGGEPGIGKTAMERG